MFIQIGLIGGSVATLLNDTLELLRLSMKGYINKPLADLLFDDGIQFITTVRRNIKQKALSNEEKLLLRKRSVIETVNDELKIFIR